MNEKGLSKNEIITQLARSTHGKLEEYLTIGREAAKTEPAFFAHLIAWNRQKGQVRDSKVALPIVALTTEAMDPEFTENALAHLTLLNPRLLLKAYHFALDVRDKKLLGGRMGQLHRLIQGYLRNMESNPPRFERTALQHRRVLMEMYRLTHTKPADAIRPFILSRPADVLSKRKGGPGGKPMEYPKGSLFEAVANLRNMSALEAAGVILTRKIPFLVAIGALGDKAKDPDLVLALINAMSPNELVNNTNMLDKLGMKNNSALRGAYQAALAKVSDSTANLLKTTRAIENLEDEELQQQLRSVQEKQIQKSVGIEGNWLVLGDRSPSMKYSVEVAKEVAGTLAKMVKGKVWLIFFDQSPMTVDVTGLSLDQIKKATRHITADGNGTSIGCGLARMLDENIEVDGIAVVSDGGENWPPYFHDVYGRYCKKFEKEVPTYLYLTNGDVDRFSVNMRGAGHDLQTFDLRDKTTDFYSLPNLVQTMRASRYSLLDEILGTPLLKLADVYKNPELKSVSA